MDELFCRVRRTGKMWLWLAIDPVTKILPSLHLGHRKNDDAMTLTHDLKLRLKSDCVPAFTTYGLRGYFYDITAHFGHWFRPQRARTDHWQISENLLYGQLVKRHKRGASKFAIMRMLWGKRKDLNVILQQLGFAALIQTAFIERVNLTIRRDVASLMRKTWSLAQTLNICSCMSNGGAPTIISSAPMSPYQYRFPVCTSSDSTPPLRLLILPISCGRSRRCSNCPCHRLFPDNFSSPGYSNQGLLGCFSGDLQPKKRIWGSRFSLHRMVFGALVQVSPPLDHDSTHPIYPFDPFVAPKLVDNGEGGTQTNNTA
jgi:IS1 family transposase